MSYSVPKPSLKKNYIYTVSPIAEGIIAFPLKERQELELANFEPCDRHISHYATRIPSHNLVLWKTL